MLGTTTNLSMPVSSSRVALGLTVTANIKKQDLKSVKNVKGCRDGMPKSMQQSRNDIIV